MQELPTYDIPTKSQSFIGSIAEVCQQQKEALDRAEAAYQDPNSPHYRDNERFKWAVETINRRFEEKP